MIDYYAVLEVNPSASYNQIRSAYRRLAFRYHPDVATASEGVDQMKLLNEAFSILSSPVKRARYDFLRAYTDQPTTFHPTRSTPRSSSTAYSSNPRSGSSVGQKQPGYYKAADSQNDWVHKIMLFSSELIYHLIRDLLVVFLYLIPMGFYFYILGRLSIWISPGISDSPFLMGELFVGSFILTYLTVRLFRKRILLLNFLQRFRF